MGKLRPKEEETVAQARLNLELAAESGRKPRAQPSSSLGSEGEHRTFHGVSGEVP